MPHKCPVCGATESTTGNPFESRDSLVAHMSGKKDEDHKGIGPQRAKAMLDANDSNGDSGTSDQGETLEMPTDDSQGDTGDGSGDECPECGADAGNTSGLSDGDTLKCTECGETLVWRDS